MTAVRARPRTIDDFLGAGGQRFFGAGYRRVYQQIRDLNIEHDQGAGSLRAVAAVTYPADWSRKRPDADLRPHLSSVDALTLGAQLADATMAIGHGLSADERRRCWLRHVDMRAGTSPVQDLTAIPVSSQFTATDITPVVPDSRVSLVHSTIGELRIRCTVEHPAGRVQAGRTLLPQPADVLGPAEATYYGGAFRRRRQLIDDVTVDRAITAVQAQVRIGPFPARAPTVGLEGAYQPATTMLDAVVSVAQLAQVLLYDLDAINRQDSNTLWMRRVSMTSHTPPHRHAAPAPTTTRMTRSRLVDVHGARWRVSDLAAAMHGIDLRASVAHALPTAHPTREPTA